MSSKSSQTVSDRHALGLIVGRGSCSGSLLAEVRRSDDLLVGSPF